jgi:two-component system, chemotaxis family, protein-glutamate methylesterase/glutaminase
LPLRYKAIVIGLSSGGLQVLKEILSEFPADFALPLIIVQHVGPYSEGYFIEFLGSYSKLKTVEAEEKELIRAGTAYFAPANYHLLIEKDHSFSLSTDEKVKYARPSIDVLFESAADAYAEQLIGVLLTGANDDGASGLKTIKERGGLTIIQDPLTAEFPEMPMSASRLFTPHHILSIQKIINLLTELGK